MWVPSITPITLGKWSIWANWCIAWTLCKAVTGIFISFLAMSQRALVTEFIERLTVPPRLSPHDWAHTIVPTHDCAHTWLCPHTIVPTHDCAQTRLCPHMIVPTHDCAHTRLCPHMIVPTHDSAHTRLCPHTIVPTHDCAHTRLCPHTIVPTRLCPHMIVPRHDCAHTRLCPHTIVPTHDCAQTRLCPHTIVPTHVCALTCYTRVVTITSGHKCVWARILYWIRDKISTNAVQYIPNSSISLYS